MAGGFTRIRLASSAEDGPSADAWREALDDPGWLRRAAVLKEQGPDWVRRATLRVGSALRDVVIKRRAVRGPVEALKTLAGRGRLTRQWEGAVWLHGRGIGTARPLVLVRRVGAAGGEEVLVTEALEGRTLLQHMADPALPVPRRRALAVAAGRLAARLVLAGRYNRDHKPSNLIVTRLTDADAELAIIDTVAIRPCLTDLWGLDRMLASLVLEPAGCGCAPDPWLMRAAVCAAAADVTRGRARPARLTPVLAWFMWRSAAAIVEAHGDPTPRVNPLTAPV